MLGKARGASHTPWPAIARPLRRSTSTSRSSTSEAEPSPLAWMLRGGGRSSIVKAPAPARRSGAFDQLATYPSAVFSDQAPVIEACLRGGNVRRAITVWQRLKDYARADGQIGALKLAVPAYLHAEFLRAFFQLALDGRQSVEASLTEACRWWEMLVREADVVGEPSVEAFGVMLKGVIALQQRRTTGVDRPLRGVLDEMRRRDISLTDICRLPLFRTASLGTMTIDEFLTGLAEMADGAGDIGWAEAVVVARNELGSAVETLVPVAAPPRDDLALTAELPLPVRRARMRDGSVVMEKPFGLGNLQGHIEASLGMATDSLDDYQRQRLLETKAQEAGALRSEHDQQTVDADTRMGTADLQSLLVRWNEAMVEDLTVQLAAHRKARSRTAATYKAKDAAALNMPGKIEEEFLELLSPEALAHTTAVTILRAACARDHRKVGDALLVTGLVISVGRAVQDEYAARRLAELDPGAIDRAREQNRQGELPLTLRTDKDLLTYCWRKAADRAEAGKVEGPYTRMPEWSTQLHVRIGSALVDTFIRVATIERTKGSVRETQPAFSLSNVYRDGRRYAILRPNPELLERMSRDSLTSIMQARFLPMIVPPRLWIDWDQGGFLTVSSSALRIKDSVEQRLYLKSASDAGDLDKIFAALDFLGGCAWRINDKVFATVIRAWNSNIEIGKLPTREGDSHLEDPVKPATADEDIVAMTNWRKERIELGRARRGLHSERCDVNYKIEIARAFLGRRFYFPHNLDFRGRAYPISPHFSHINHDLCRGLLQFAESRPLGPRGLHWLKVQVANTMGNDKISLLDRAAWVDEHIDDVYDSADQPLDGRRWWTGGDDPWQALAAMTDLAAALRHPDGPEAYASAIPVQQDGSCNGLQHYAALGGDLVGAEHVNLVQGDKPGDVYTAVAKRVAEIVHKEAGEGNPLAKLVDGRIVRKLVKQVVMTTVYGVTFMGAKAMIRRQLKDMDGFATNMLDPLSIYLAIRVMASIGDVFKGANAIKAWLQTCARLIAQSVPADRAEGVGKRDERMTTVVWTTPLGLPVVQPYRAVEYEKIHTVLARIRILDATKASPTDPRRQSAALPPNYIHSLDASHMMMTATECKKRGIAFASVHDSYWTHAADVDEMSAVLRDAFVELHSQPLLDDLRDEWLQRYAGYRVAHSVVKEDPSAETDVEVIDDEDVSLDPADEDVEPEATIEPDEVIASPKKRKSAPRKRTRKVNPDEASALLTDVLPPVPPRGPFQVSNVRKSTYFFS